MGIKDRLGDNPTEQQLATIGGIMGAVAEAWEKAMHLVAGGNAGGVVSTLALFGTMVGLREGALAPPMIFWALVIFLLGLGTAIVTRFLDFAHHFRSFMHFPDNIDAAADKFARRMFCWQGGLAICSGLCLVTGTILGLIQLWQLIG